MLRRGRGTWRRGLGGAEGLGEEGFAQNDGVNEHRRAGLGAGVVLLAPLLDAGAGVDGTWRWRRASATAGEAGDAGGPGRGTGR